MHRAATVTSRINLLDQTEFICSSPLNIFLPRNLSYVGQQNRLRKNRLYAMDLVNHKEHERRQQQEEEHPVNSPKDTFVILNKHGDSQVSLNPFQWDITESNKRTSSENGEQRRQSEEEKPSYNTILTINTQLEKNKDDASDTVACKQFNGLSIKNDLSISTNHTEEKISLSDKLPSLKMCTPNLLSTKCTCSSSNCMPSPIYQENEFSYNNLRDYRRSSSLKSRKTPPNTPSLKKEVRFADAFGLDLTSVRMVFNTDSPPSIPPEALSNLQLSESPRPDVEQFVLSIKESKFCIWQPNFIQPGARPEFVQLVQDRNVCLENAIAHYSTIEGIVRVKNIAFQKQVWIRYTTNNWRTFGEVAAKYAQGSCNGITDRFNFTISIPEKDVPINQTLFFCIRFVAAGQIMWDSNNGKNYGFVYSNRKVIHVS